MKILRDIIQGSPEWEEARRGLATASHASEIITPAKGEYSKSARKYLFQLLADCGWAGDDVPDFKSAAMERGNRLEPVAREAFKAHTDLAVEEVGLCVAADNICACSPDGLIPDGKVDWLAGLEIKCPTKKEHAGYVLDGVLPDEYKAQVHWSLAVTGLSRWHFWSFHPCYKPLHLVVERDAFTAKIEAAMKQFVAEYRKAYTLAETNLFIPPELIEEVAA